MGPSRLLADLAGEPIRSFPELMGGITMGLHNLPFSDHRQIVGENGAPMMTLVEGVAEDCQSLRRGRSGNNNFIMGDR